MVINLKKNSNSKFILSSYITVKVIRHNPDKKLLVLEVASGGVFDFYYEGLGETVIKVGAKYQIFIIEYKGDNEKGDAQSGIQFIETYPDKIPSELIKS